MTHKKIRVFIVDDSALVRTSLTMILSRAADIDVLGSAANPNLALTKMKRDWPDVIISDLEMPEMHGIDFLKYLNANHPTPFIVCSSYAGVGARNSIDALSLGAVDIISKPSLGVEAYLEEINNTILDSIRAAANLLTSRKLHYKYHDILPQAEQIRQNESTSKLTSRNNFTVIAIGSSTGGTVVIEALLKKMTKNCPPLLIVQHMPMYFTAAFARRLNEICAIHVKEAEDGEQIEPGVAYIAPGGYHMELSKKNAGFLIRIHDGPQINRHKPSVDVLFDSVAENIGSLSLGVILTGMGRDGARGILKMNQKGALTLAQDEASCAVYGMPKAAQEVGAIDTMLSASDICHYLGGISHG